VGPAAAVRPGHEHVLLSRYFCGVGAVSRTAPFWITVMVNGVLAVVEPALSCSPPGFDARGRVTVLGWSSSLVVVVVRPPESLAVSWITREEG
jgi:hypothetical protein